MSNKKLFDFVIGNPPYQEETAKKESENNQKTTRNIFQFFQESADKTAEEGTCLIYPAGRWIHQAGKGMSEFGKEQMNDSHLARLVFYKKSSDVFDDVAINDGISIVVKNMHKTSKGFEYEYHDGEELIVTKADNPKDNLFVLYPKDSQIAEKIDSFVKQNHLDYLDKSILPRSLFGIESDFVSKNSEKVRLLQGNEEIDYTKYIKLLTNDKPGSKGRTRWYVTSKDTVKKGVDYIGKWKVVVISANPGGQRRDNQLEIIDNHSAFGRSKVALKVFDTKEEAENFYKYMDSVFIRYSLLLTNENLTAIAKRTPDLLSYTDNNKYIDYSKDVNTQLYKLFNLSSEEISYIENRVTNLRGKNHESK